MIKGIAMTKKRHLAQSPVYAVIGFAALFLALFSVASAKARIIPLAGGSSGVEKIAFHSNRSGSTQIYIMNADGGYPRRLTNHPAMDGRPSWGKIPVGSPQKSSKS